MKKITASMFMVLLALAGACSAELYTIYGSMNSSGSLRIDNHYTLARSQQGLYAIRTIIPIVHSQLTSPLFQTITDLQVTYHDTYPNGIADVVDTNGNPCKLLVWGDTAAHTIYFQPNDTDFFSMRSEGQFWTQLVLNGLCDGTPYPCNTYPDSVRKFLEATPEVQSDDPGLILFAQRNFAVGSYRSYDVVNKIFNWARNKMNYGNGFYDALRILGDSLESDPRLRHVTTCIGLAHLPIAFLRALGIPARYVSGYTLNGGTYFPRALDSACHSSAHASHAWAEVYYLDEGWIPFDVQRFNQFIDPMRIRMQHGYDSKRAHPELYVPTTQGYTVGPYDWYNLYVYEEDLSVLLCSPIQDPICYWICTSGQLRLKIHGPETNGDAWTDRTYPLMAGDANCDSHVDIGDAIYIMNYCFKGGPAPTCGPNGDANGDCHIQVGDAVYIINYVFKGGPAPIHNPNCAWPVVHDDAYEEIAK